MPFGVQEETVGGPLRGMRKAVVRRAGVREARAIYLGET